MFKPNRVGTPTYHNQAVTVSSAVTALATSAVTSTLIGNVMNATPMGKLGRCYVRHNAAAKALGAGLKTSLMAQVLVDPPVRGDVVGIEVNLALALNIPGVNVVPCIVQQTAAIGTVFNAYGNIKNSMTPLKHDTVYTPATQVAMTTPGGRVYSCQDNIILRDEVTGDPSGVYGIGFALYNYTAVSIDLTAFEFWASVRQNMDQPGVGYADSRR